MKFLSRLFCVTPECERRGAHLDYSSPFWEISCETDFPTLFETLRNHIPKPSYFYFEGGDPTGELAEFLITSSVSDTLQIARGTLWPRPKVYQIPSSADNIDQLIRLSQSCDYPELAIHFHVHTDSYVWLEWHDAFGQELLISGSVPEEIVSSIAHGLTGQYKKGKMTQTEQCG